MYFYEIEVYRSFFENGKIIMGHDNCFDNYQLAIIVQEAFDECIEKYCDKLVLDEGEEACRMRVGTIFEKYLPLQLENRGFKSIKVKAKSFIQGGALFVDDECNPVLKNRYKDKILPICKKCERIGNDGKCIVPNTRKDNNLPTTRVSCEFDSDEDKEKSKKLLEDYGFVLEDDKDGFWITGVKE